MKGIAQLIDVALETSVVGSFTRIGAAWRNRLFDWESDEASRADLSGKVAVVTGATSGIGAAAAIALASKGARVWILGRDEKRGHEVIEEAKRASADQTRTENATDRGAANVRFAKVNMADLSDVEAFCKNLLAVEQQVDILIHNAGALVHTEQRTPQGLELTTAVHVIAPMLMTERLLPALRASGHARVITVSSGGMYAQALRIDELDSPRSPYDGVQCYANAKRAQVVLNEVWAEKEPSILFAAMHPGWVDTPGVATSLPTFRRFTRPLLRTTTQGADTIVWLAATKTFATGQFWCDRRSRKTERMPGTHTSTEQSQALWLWASEKVKLRVS